MSCPQKNCTQMCIATLFIITKYWKQLKYPYTGEMINKVWHIKSEILLSNCKELLTHATWKIVRNVERKKARLKKLHTV